MSAERDAIRASLRAQDDAKLEARIDAIVAEKRAQREAEEAAAAKREERRQRRAQRTAGVINLRSKIAEFQGVIIEPGAKLLAEIEAAAAEVAAFTEPADMSRTTEWLERTACELVPSMVFAWKGFPGVVLSRGLMELQPAWDQKTRWPDRVQRDPAHDDPDEDAGAAC